MQIQRPRIHIYAALLAVFISRSQADLTVIQQAADFLVGIARNVQRGKQVNLAQILLGQIQLLAEVCPVQAQYIRLLCFGSGLIRNGCQNRAEMAELQPVNGVEQVARCLVHHGFGRFG